MSRNNENYSKKLIKKKYIKKIAHPAGDRMMLLKQKILSDPKKIVEKKLHFQFLNSPNSFKT